MKQRSAAEVLLELQGQINHLDLLIAVLQREVDDEQTQARACEQQSIIALDVNREDLAAQALRHRDRHANAAAVKDAELVELERVRASYLNAIAAVEASLERRVE